MFSRQSLLVPIFLLSVQACSGQLPLAHEPVDGGAESSDFSDLALGRDHSCALYRSAVYCWGDNDEGQLGNASGQASLLPVAVEGIPQPIAISAGYNTTCALTAGARLYCWGRGQGVEEIPLSNVRAVSTSLQHTCTLVGEGQIRCWGNNDFGQLGDGTQSSATADAPARVSGLDDAIAISTGTSFSCAVRADGTVLCWGGNQYGQLGDGTLVDKALPTPVLSLQNALSISSFYRHTCAHTADARVYCWGYGDNGEVGAPGLFDANPTPHRLEFPGVQQVAAGGRHTCLLSEEGRPHCWGQLREGQTGSRSGSVISPAPVQVIERATLVATGLSHSCALSITPPGVHCWGEASSGQIGPGNVPFDNFVPSLVPFPDAPR